MTLILLRLLTINYCRDLLFGISEYECSAVPDASDVLSNQLLHAETSLIVTQPGKVVSKHQSFGVTGINLSPDNSKGAIYTKRVDKQ